MAATASTELVELVVFSSVAGFVGSTSEILPKFGVVLTLAVEYIKISNHCHRVGNHFELSSLQSILALFDFGKFHIIPV